MRDFLSFAAFQAVAYFILVANIRAVAHLNYPMAVVTESSYLLFQWVIIRRVVVADSWQAMAGFITGGTVGSLFSMWVTRGWS